MTMAVGYEEMPTDEELLAQAREEGESDGQELLWDVAGMQKHPLDTWLPTVVLLWDDLEAAYAALEEADRVLHEAELNVDKAVNGLIFDYTSGTAGEAMRAAQYRVRQIERRIEHLSRKGLLLSMVQLGKQ